MTYTDNDHTSTEMSLQALNCARHTTQAYNPAGSQESQEDGIYIWLFMVQSLQDLDMEIVLRHSGELSPPPHPLEYV